ncbi:hypothetical protein [Ancylobacter pratisalsi]|uniref:Uncharacterized protein n=1 Tax=Ancylobacter pratisalsi TaxID=1745854 RepID=A0A6P1YUL8_9HYPH|nr:hypothetical protein [Ancylobacter pratisalsi]QIB36541.1 hypothetical protein G3A50_22255 [Ancylobacter pratisalsi]
MALIIKSAERDLAIAGHLVRGLMLLTEELVPDDNVCDALAAMNLKAKKHIEGAMASLTVLTSLTEIEPAKGSQPRVAD